MGTTDSFEKRSILIQGQNRSPITKWTLLKKFVLQAMIIGVCVGAAMGLFALAVGFLYSDSVLNPTETVLLALFTFAISWGLIVVILSIVFLSAFVKFFRLITVQEKSLNFSFCEEMRSRGISRLSYRSSDWFISLDQAPLIALNRKFITQAEEQKLLSPFELKIILTDINGREWKIRSHHSSMVELEKWLSSESGH